MPGGPDSEDGTEEERYVVGASEIDPDKYVVRTEVRYVRSNAAFRALAAEYSQALRRMTGSESVRAWPLPGSDGKSGDVHTVMDRFAVEAFLIRVLELEKREREGCRADEEIRRIPGQGEPVGGSGATAGGTAASGGCPRR